VAICATLGVGTEPLLDDNGRPANGKMVHPRPRQRARPRPVRVSGSAAVSRSGSRFRAALYAAEADPLSAAIPW